MIGTSFDPSSLNDPTKKPQLSAGPYQQAIKILSLHLPRVLGGSALADTSLLGGQSNIGSPFTNPIIASILQSGGVMPPNQVTPGGSPWPIPDTNRQPMPPSPGMPPLPNEPRLPMPPAPPPPTPDPNIIVNQPTRTPAPAPTPAQTFPDPFNQQRRNWGGLTQRP